MSRFSPTDAALEGVRLSRERPRAIVVWTAYYFAFTFLLGVLASLTLGPHAQDLLNEAKKSQSDPAEVDRMLSQFWPFAAIGYPLLLAFKAMLTGALYRTILNADAHPAVRLRLGVAELRL